MNLKLTVTFKACKDCALEKAKKAGVSKMLVERSKIKGKRFFIDISPLPRVNMGGKEHWILVLDDNTNHAWSYFFKEKSELKDIMVIFLMIERQIKVLMPGTSIVTMLVRMKPLKGCANRKGWFSNSSILHQACNNRMNRSNRNLLQVITENELC